jgi:urease accessory protein
MTKYLTTCALLASTMTPLLAHPGHGESGFVAGLMHPLSGLDHLLAMVAVGILGVRCGGRGLWMVPLTFMSCMVLGGLLATTGMPVPLADWGIALSVLVFGGMAAIASTPRSWVSCLVVGSFALLHGCAHVAEMEAGQGRGPYVSGFLLATAALHASGIGFAVLATRSAPPVVLRVAGGAIATASVICAVQLA